MTKSSPPICVMCRGTGKVIVLAADFDELDAEERVRYMVGFFRRNCLYCFTTGLAYYDEHGSFAPCPVDYEP